MFQNTSNVKVGLADSYEFGRFIYYETDIQNEIYLRINGTKLLNIWAFTGINAGTIEINTSFGTFNHQIWDNYSHYDRITCGSFNPEIKCIPNEKIIIKLINLDIDYSVCTRKLENTKSILKKLRIIGISYL